MFGNLQFLESEYDILAIDRHQAVNILNLVLNFVFVVPAH